MKTKHKHNEKDAFNKESKKKRSGAKPNRTRIKSKIFNTDSSSYQNHATKTKSSKNFVLDPQRLKRIFEGSTSKKVTQSDLVSKNIPVYGATGNISSTLFQREKSSLISAKPQEKISANSRDHSFSLKKDVKNTKNDGYRYSLSLAKEKGLAVSRLQSAKFRFLNEKLYKSTGAEALEFFKKDPSSFSVYHSGYQQQVEKWPVNPLDIIIKQLKELPSDLVIADMGCGDAKIARTFPERTVHSFDLFSSNDCVTVCDISNVPLAKASVDICIFCLSLMGTNLLDYIREANRILKLRGLLILAEVQSRFEDQNSFKRNMKTLGFKLKEEDWKQTMFTVMMFKKKRKSPDKCILQNFHLSPCLYKKR